MLRTIKLTVLRVLRTLGVFRLVRNSRWRRRHLLVLCYHGISIDDEHECLPGLYMPVERFASRLEQLRRGRYNVLPLDEALRRASAGTLPPRAVAITFDDGNFDFFSRAWPVLQAYAMPATVYLTTYYSEKNLPVFPLIASYVLWKGRGAATSLVLPDGTPLALDTRTRESRRLAQDALVLYAQDRDLSAAEKDALAASLADAVGVDYQAIRRARLLHIMNGEEVRALAAQGADVQLHSHRHRSPLDRARYRAEVSENRERIEALTGRVARHFCYPSGILRPQFEQWLAEEGVASATTCEPGMVTARSNPFRLPRLLDASGMTSLEFEAWLSGLGALLPRRPVGMHDIDEEGRPRIARAPHPAALSAEV